MTQSTMFAYLVITVSYFLGSVPFGLLIGRIVGKVDIREAGSRNTGATNVARLVGLPWGLLALALDILKGLGPVLLIQALTDDPLLWSLAGAMAMIGHVWSAFLRFSGGKAVATTIGVFLGLAFWPALASVGVCVAAIALSGYVSLGSLTLALALPVACALMGKTEIVPLALFTTLLLFWRHRENIIRLVRGQENTFWKKKA